MNNENITRTLLEPDNGLILDIEFDTSLKIGFEDESDHEVAEERVFALASCIANPG